MLPGLSAHTRSTVRRGATLTNPAAVCGCRKATSFVGEQQHGRRLRGRRSQIPRGGEIATRKPAAPIFGERTQLPPNGHSDFDFDPFPPKIFSARPKPLEKSGNLGTTKNTLGGARHRNVELGRSLICTYGSADIATQALRAAYLRDRSRRRRAADSWHRNRWNLNNMHREWQEQRRVPGFAVSFAQQVIGIREAALEQAKGFEKLQASFLMQQDLAWASTLEFMYPFELHLKLQEELFHLLSRTPLWSIQDLALQGRALNKELGVLISSLSFWKASIDVPSTFERRYGVAKQSAFDALNSGRASLGSLWTQCESLAAFTGDARSAIGRLAKPLRAFKHGLRPFVKAHGDAETDLILIRLRRLSSNAGCQQNVFNSLHHHFKSTRALGQHHHRSSQRAIKELCKEAKMVHLNSEGRIPPVLRYEQAILEALDRVHTGMEELVRFYYDEFLPFWDASIRLMSPSELERQDRIARKYWLFCYSSDREYELRQTELADIYDHVHKARFLSSLQYPVQRAYRSYHERAREAIARLSKLYLTQDRITNPSARFSCNILPQGRATTTLRGHAASDSNQTVLWQPGRHSTVEDQPSGSAASRSLKQLFLFSLTSSKSARASNVELIPFNRPKVTASRRSHSGHPALPTAVEIWGEAHTAERLLARYKILDAALKACDARQETVKRREWDREDFLRKDRWKNAAKLSEVLLRRNDLIMFYHEQRAALYEAVYQKTQDITKLCVSDLLLKERSTLSILRQMRPFEDQVDLLSWLYLTIGSCPHPKLRESATVFRLLHSDMQALVVQLSRIRLITVCHFGYEKRYEITKRTLSAACEDLAIASAGLWAVNLGHLNDLAVPDHLRLRRRIIDSNISLKAFTRFARQTAEDLIVIGMRRYGDTGNRQQNVFNSLHHHVKYMHASTRVMVVSIQRIYKNLTYDAVERLKKINGSLSRVLAHEVAVVRTLRELDATNRQIARLYYDEFLPLRHRHLDFMSPAELERQNGIAQRYWLARLTSSTAKASKETCLDDLHRRISRAHGLYALGPKHSQGRTVLPQWPKGNAKYQEQAIEAIQSLEQIFPSQSPKSIQALKITLGIEKDPRLSSRCSSLEPQAPKVTFRKDS